MTVIPRPRHLSRFNRDQTASRKEDEFKRWEFAGNLARTIETQPLGDPLVISIIGPWGSGKSTAMGYLHDLLANPPKGKKACRIAEFNPWSFAGEETLLLHLFEALMQAIDPNKKLLTKGRQLLKMMHQKKESLIKLLTLAGDSYLPLAGQATGALLSALIPAEFRQQLEEAFDETAVYLAAKDLRVVMLLDDVDRLEPQDILLLFRALKLTANLPNTTFVMAMDEDHVSQIIGRHIDGHQLTGRRYIEKIVNVRLALPAIPPHILSRYLLKRLSGELKRTQRELPRETGRFVRYIFDRLHAPFITTPRLAKAVQNAFAFALDQLPEDEVNTGDVLLLEATRMLHPDMHQALQEVIPNIKGIYNLNPHQKQEEEKKREEDRWEHLLKSIGTPELQKRLDAQEGLRAWFPQIRAGYSGRQEDWQRDRRICSMDYFWRHFSGTIQKDDVSNTVVREWVDSVRQEGADPEKGLSRLEEHLAESYAPAFLAKLKMIPDLEADPAAVLKVLTWQASRSEGTSEPETDTLLGDTQSNTENVILSLLTRQADETVKDRLASQVIHNSASLEWSLQMFRYLDLHARSQSMTAFHKTLSDECLKAYEEGRLLKDSFMILLWAVAINAMADVPGIQKRIAALVSKRPEVALHLLTETCTHNSVDEKRPWFWQGEERQQSVYRVIKRPLLKKALQSLALPPLPKPGQHRRQTLEEVGRLCLTTLSQKKQLPGEQA